MIGRVSERVSEPNPTEEVAHSFQLTLSCYLSMKNAVYHSNKVLRLSNRALTIDASPLLHSSRGKSQDFNSEQNMAKRSKENVKKLKHFEYLKSKQIGGDNRRFQIQYFTEGISSANSRALI